MLGVTAPDEKRITRSIPTHELDLLSDCAPEDLARIGRALAEAIRFGAPAYNAGDHEACFRKYEATALELDRTLERCSRVRKALLDGISAALAREGYTLKAWAMRDAFDGVLDVIERKLEGQAAGVPAYIPVRRVTKQDVSVLKGASPEAIARIRTSIGDAIEVGAPLYNDGHAEACFRIYEGAVLNLLRGQLPVGAQRLLEAGLERSAGARGWEAKAWAMRDTFDELLEVIARRRDNDLN